MGVFNKTKLIFSSAMLCAGLAMAQPGVPPPPGMTTDPNAVGGTATIVTEGWKPSLRRDGAIDRVEHNNYVTPWQPIREADVLWKKRVWRELDTRQKQNFPFRYPGDDESGGGMYIEILMDALKKGSITAFSDDRFTTPLTVDDVMALVVGKPDTVYVDKPDGTTEMRIINKSFNPEAITKFRLKEDWIFDKNLGRMVVRIIGLAPYIDRYNEDGSYRLSLPMFWLYYPDVRPTNARFEVYNPENDVYRITWDDFFEKRVFSSYIIKSTINNPLQDDIKNYKQGIDRLNESEALREKIFNKEHDLWVY
ncbi:MAG: gliding motility protein GldN [Chitinophagaceae bacterium]|nr:gliding motility protein GldN [Chitinophagaceae bacterium]